MADLSFSLGMDVTEVTRGSQQVDTAFTRLTSTMTTLAAQWLRYSSVLGSTKTPSQDIQKNIDGMSKSIKDAGEQADKSGGVLSRMFEKIKSAASGIGSIFSQALSFFGGGLLMKAFDSLTGGMSDLVHQTIEYHDALEKGRIAFTTFTGSAEEASRVMGQLQAFAARTPFHFPEVVELASRLNAIGYDVKDLIPLMTTLSDTTAALGGGADKLNTLVHVFGQMQANARLTGIELRELQMAAVPVADVVAKKLGYTSDQFRALVEQGKISSRGFAQILRGYLDEAYGGMTQQVTTKTVEGQMSNLTDNILGLTSKAGEGAIQTMINTLDAVNNLLSSGGATKLADAMNKYVSVGLAPFNTFLQDLSQGKGFMEAGKDAAKAFWDEFKKTVVPALQDVWTEWGPKLMAFGQQLGDNIVAGIGQAFDNLKDFITKKLKEAGLDPGKVGAYIPGVGTKELPATPLIEPPGTPGTHLPPMIEGPLQRLIDKADEFFHSMTWGPFRPSTQAFPGAGALLSPGGIYQQRGSQQLIDPDERIRKGLAPLSPGQWEKVMRDHQKATEDLTKTVDSTNELLTDTNKKLPGGGGTPGRTGAPVALPFPALGVLPPLQATTPAILKFTAEMRGSTDALETGADAAKLLERSHRGVTQATNAQIIANRRLVLTSKDWVETLQAELPKTFTQSLTDLLTGAKGFGDSVKGLFQGIWQTIAAKISSNLIDKLFTDKINSVISSIIGALSKQLTGSSGSGFWSTFLNVIGAALGLVSGIAKLPNKSAPNVPLSGTGGVVVLPGSGPGFGGTSLPAPGSLPYGGGQQSGGFVYPGRSYMVGEAGPETFVPTTRGYIVPNRKGGGDVAINISVGDSNQVQNRKSREQIINAARRELQWHS